MTVITNTFRSLAIGGEPALSGAQGLESNMGERLQEDVATGADDTPIAFGGFSKASLDAISVVSSQDVIVKIGSNQNPWHIEDFTALGDGTSGQGGSLTADGNSAHAFWRGDECFIQGSNDADNDGRYVIKLVDDIGNQTFYQLHSNYTWNGIENFFATIEPGLAGTTMTKIAPMETEIGMNGDTMIAPSTLEIGGDLSHWLPKQKINTGDFTDPANNAIWTIVSATYDGVNTTVVVEEATVVNEGGGIPSYAQLIATELVIHLKANEPFMWTKDSGIPNPVLGDVDRMLITNESGSTADIQARIIKSSP